MPAVKTMSDRYSDEYIGPWQAGCCLIQQKRPSTLLNIPDVTKKNPSRACVGDHVTCYMSHKSARQLNKHLSVK